MNGFSIFVTFSSLDLNADIWENERRILDKFYIFENNNMPTSKIT